MTKKFFSYFLVSLFVLSLNSCGNDNEPNVPEEETPEEIQYKDLSFISLAKLIDADSSAIEDLYDFKKNKSAQADEPQTVAYVADEFGYKYKLFYWADDNKKIERMRLMPVTGENEDLDSDIFKIILEKSTSLKLGTFLGTKFINTTTQAGGIKQTVEETISLIPAADKHNICTLFGTTTKSRTVPYLNAGKLRIEFCRNYLPLDFTTIGQFLNRNIDEVLSEYYEIANKLQFGTALSYLVFSKGVDNQGNAYDVNMDSDKSLVKIKEVSIYIAENDNTITRWIDLLKNSAKYNLGSNPVFYVNDVFGEKLQDLDSAEAAIEIYETNGRQNGIVAKYETPYSYNSVVLNKDYCFILITQK